MWGFFFCFFLFVFCFLFLDNLLTVLRTVSNTHAQVAKGTIVCKSRALITCNVLCHVVRTDSSATEFDRVKIAFILFSFYWLKRPTDEGEGGGMGGGGGGGGETGVPRENSRR